MVKTRYVLCRVSMTGVPSFYCDGIIVTDTMKETDEFHGGAHERLSVTYGEHTVTWQLQNPRDHMALKQFVINSRLGQSGTITVFGEDEKGVFRALERLDGCECSTRKSTFGSFKAVQLDMQGTADSTTPLEATYA